MRHLTGLKEAVFHPAVRSVIRAFPPGVRHALGGAIWDLQRGLRIGMPLSRSMPSIAPGAAELRVKDRSGAYRVFYVSATAQGVLVFHAFTKKTAKTPDAEIRLAKKRLRELLDG